MKGYSTKYALTVGLRAVVTDDKTKDSSYVYVAEPGRQQLKVGRDFFETIEEAEANAKERAVKKIASLKRALAKMRVLVKKPKWGRPE